MSREIARWAIMCGGGNGSRAFPDYGHVKFTRIPTLKNRGGTRRIPLPHGKRFHWYDTNPYTQLRPSCGGQTCGAPGATEIVR
jgi:hypothetical protein